MAEKFRVKVSEAMDGLRKLQTALNGFWQTSELAHGYLLSRAATEFPDPDRPTIEVLGHVESEVWFPNNQGTIKKTDTIGTTLKQAHANTVQVYRATQLSFYSGFEAYLDDRVGPLRLSRNKGHKWGPFVETLSLPVLRDAAYPIEISKVLCADLMRLIRNRIVHGQFAVPQSVSDSSVLKWASTLVEQACNAGWPKEEVNKQIKFAVNHAIGQAENGVVKAQRRGKQLPIELFYMLHTFTNLDRLAFQIEEALQPPSPTTPSSIRTFEVRRKDLIISN